MRVSKRIIFLTIVELFQIRCIPETDESWNEFLNKQKIMIQNGKRHLSQYIISVYNKIEYESDSGNSTNFEKKNIRSILKNIS